MTSSASDDAQLDAARSLLSSARSITAFTGAGLSAESGVATFRSSEGHGLWAQYDPTRLASPEGFAEDKQLVMDWYAMRRRQIAAAEPNAAHRALAARSDVVNVTQNVDDLLRRAGAADPIQVHGRIDLDRCHGGCGYRETIDLHDPPPLRCCPECGADLRPGVVWFGEMLDPQVWDAAERAWLGCDTVLVVGTSAVVYPAAGLIGLAQSAGARVIIVNPEASGASALADVEIRSTAATILPRLLG